VLMPAALAILGDRAWYLPRWLGRLPKLTIEGPAAPAAPVPAAESGTEAGLPSR
jgi:RND superfamily putative drug exporter